jgi:predicted phosphodiesterase
VLYGHTHAQIVKRIGRTTVVNPGSAGDGRDSRNNRLLSCGVIDTATGEVRIIDYPDRRFPG